MKYCFKIEEKKSFQKQTLQLKKFKYTHKIQTIGCINSARPQTFYGLILSEKKIIFFYIIMITSNMTIHKYHFHSINKTLAHLNNEWRDFKDL